MNPFQQSIEFWIIVAAAIVFKISTSERLSALGVIATVSGSVLAAVVGTDLVVELAGLQSQTATYAVACLLGLTGEDMIRRVIIKSRSGESPLGILKWLRGDDGKGGDDGA